MSGPASPQIRDENDEISLFLGSPTLQSRMSKSDPTRLLLEYTRLMMGFLLFVPHPRHITMIGLGGGLAGQVLPPPAGASPLHRRRIIPRG